MQLSSGKKIGPFNTPLSQLGCVKETAEEHLGSLKTSIDFKNKIAEEDEDNYRESLFG